MFPSQHSENGNTFSVLMHAILAKHGRAGTCWHTGGWALASVQRTGKCRYLVRWESPKVAKFNGP